MNTGLTPDLLKVNFKEFDLEKGGNKTGIYANTAENRKLGRVGQKYSKDKEIEELSGKKSSEKDKNISVEDKKYWLDQKGITPDQYAKDKKNPTDKEILSSYKYFKEYLEEEEDD